MVYEEVDVYEVQLVDRATHTVLETFDTGQDHDAAYRKKDEWDLEYNDGTMYTKIEVYSEELDE